MTSTPASFVDTGSVINLPAVLVSLVVTAILVKGIQESASFNALMVAVKVTVVLFVIVVGAFYINPDNWTPFAPYGWTGLNFFGYPRVRANRRQRLAAGHARRRGHHLLRLHRLRLGLDPRRGGQEPASATCRSASSSSLVICTVLYIAVVAVLTGMVPYDQIDMNAPVSTRVRAGGLGLGRDAHRRRRRRRHHVGAAGDDAFRPARVPRHGARRPGAARLLRRGPPEVPHPLEVDDPDRAVRVRDGRACCRSTRCCT